MPATVETSTTLLASAGMPTAAEEPEPVRTPITVWENSRKTSSSVRRKIREKDSKTVKVSNF
jgi:hypothetical protein